MVTLGKQLALARQVRNKSQTELAEAINVSRQLVGHFETDRAAPTPTQKLQIEAYLGLKLDDERIISLLKENSPLPQAA